MKPGTPWAILVYCRHLLFAFTIKVTDIQRNVRVLMNEWSRGYFSISKIVMLYGIEVVNWNVRMGVLKLSFIYGCLGKSLKKRRERWTKLKKSKNRIIYWTSVSPKNTEWKLVHVPSTVRLLKIRIIKLKKKLKINKFWRQMVILLKKKFNTDERRVCECANGANDQSRWLLGFWRGWPKNNENNFSDCDSKEYVSSDQQKPSTDDQFIRLYYSLL